MLNDSKHNRARLMMGAATGLVMILSGAGHAFAQEAGAPDVQESAPSADSERTLDTVVVTGIRSSIENSLLTKKNETSIVEAISAEDIGKLPDLSIADSLARLPGVTAQRVRGRSQQVSIRGLGPDFSLALLNGREVVSAGNNRGVEFDQFPSELVAQGVVYKTPDATLAATGIAGAVDLRTIRPLDYTDRRLNLSAKYSLNDNGQLNPDFNDDGYRVFASYIDQSEDGRVGWSLAATLQSNPTQFYSRELKTNQGQTRVDGASGLVYPTDNPRTGVVSREFKRTSIAGALEFEPNENWQTTIDAFYTDTEDSGIFRGVETPIASWANSGPALTGITGGSGFATSATYAPVNPILRTDTEGNTAEIFAFGVNSAYQVTDRLTLTGDYSISTLDRSDVDYESYAGTGPAGTGAFDTLTFTFPRNGEYKIGHNLDYTDPSVIVLTDPGGWGQVGFIREPDIEDELSQLRLEAEYETDLPFISGLTGGVILTERDKTFQDNAFFVRAGAGFTGGSRTISPDLIVGRTDTGSIGLDIIAYNPASLRRNGAYVLQETGATAWNVEESLATWYAMADIDGVMGNVPVRGNVGFQYVETEQSSTGTLAGGGLQTVTDEYTNFLPSLNLSFEVAPDTFIRAAAAQTITRARLDQLAANQGINLNTLVCPDPDADSTPNSVVPPLDPANGRSCWSLGGGNPFLQPYESAQFDLAFERYFDATTAVSLAVFHKDLSDWVLDRSTVVDASQQIQAIGQGAFLAANPQVAQTQLNGPVNFADGSITGIEATVRANLDNVLPPSLAGFGFTASYTYADNGLEDENGNEITIPGYSDKVWSGDVYYENHGWRSRISARHRSGFLSEVQQFDGTLSGARAQDETIVDLQVGYEWDNGPLSGFGINFEVFNLTDEPFVTENVTADPGVTFPSRHELYGRTYNVTVSRSF